MWPIVIITALVSLGSAIAAYALAPKPPKPNIPSLEEFTAPTAKQGHPIPVVFGTVWVEGPNVVWYGDPHYEPIKT